MKMLDRRTLLQLASSAAAGLVLPSSLLAQGRSVPDAFDDPRRQPESIYDPRYDDTSPPVTLDPALDRALVEIVTDRTTLSVREDPVGSNWGPEVRKYLEYCGIRRPAWWCAAFVSYEINQAAQRAGIRSSWPRFANCVDIFKWGQRHDLLLDAPGIPSVMLIPGTDRLYQHTGFVVSYDGRRTIETVEGNSNNSGSRNGIGVFRLTRRKAPGMMFVKII